MHSTIIVMLMLLDAVQQAAQPITVIVQQSPGLPEWIRILITAATGAVFGIGSSVATDFVKTTLATKKLRKDIAAQLTAELTLNLDRIGTGARILSTPGREVEGVELKRLGTMSLILDDINEDRFRHFFEEQKTLVYEFDRKNTLSEFYKICKKASEIIREGNYDLIAVQFKLATLMGHQFLRDHGIKYEEKATVWEYFATDPENWRKLTLKMPPVRED